MSLWRVLTGRTFRATDAEYLAQLYGGGDGDWNGEHVTPESARKVSAWWQSNRLYADVTGTLPLKFYKRTTDDDRVPAPEHPVARIISNEPNADNTTQEFWGAQALALRTQGNSYAEKKTASGDRLVALELLPHDTRPYRNNNGDLRYKFCDRGKEEDMPREKIFHTRAFYEGGDMGMSPLTAARRSLSTSMATERAVAQTFSKGMRAKGFFTTPSVLKPEQREQIQKTLVQPFTGASGKDWGVLEAGFDVKTVNILPKDAEMLLNRKYNLEDVCRYTGTPPILVGHASDGQTMWGSGIENIILSWRTLGLDSHLSTIEKSINRWLLSASDRRIYYAEFDRDGIMQADSAARGALIAQLIQNGQMTPNEGRKKANRHAMPGGDQLLINSTLIPLSQAGQKPTITPPGGQA